MSPNPIRRSTSPSEFSMHCNFHGIFFLAAFRTCLASVASAWYWGLVDSAQKSTWSPKLYSRSLCWRFEGDILCIRSSTWLADAESSFLTFGGAFLCGPQSTSTRFELGFYGIWFARPWSSSSNIAFWRKSTWLETRLVETLWLVSWWICSKRAVNWL